MHKASSKKKCTPVMGVLHEVKKSGVPLSERRCSFLQPSDSTRELQHVRVNIKTIGGVKIPLPVGDTNSSPKITPSLVQTLETLDPKKYMKNNSSGGSFQTCNVVSLKHLFRLRETSPFIKRTARLQAFCLRWDDFMGVAYLFFYLALLFMPEFPFYFSR